jgi:hypothetical protein
MIVPVTDLSSGKIRYGGKFKSSSFQMKWLIFGWNGGFIVPTRRMCTDSPFRNLMPVRECAMKIKIIIDPNIRAFISVIIR